MSSILIDVRKSVGCSEEDTSFDSDLIMHINSVFAILTQSGVGPKEGFEIVDETSTWNQFLNDPKLNCVKSYVCLRVKMLFDPPASGTICDVYNKTILELECRLNIECDVVARVQNGDLIRLKGW